MNRNQYDRLKLNPVKLAEFKEKLRNWHKKNYLKKKKKDPNYLKKLSNKKYEYTKQMRGIAKDIGNCSQCFKERDNPKFKRCSKCRDYARNYYNNKKITLKTDIKITKKKKVSLKQFNKINNPSHGQPVIFEHNFILNELTGEDNGQICKGKVYWEAGLEGLVCEKCNLYTGIK